MKGSRVIIAAASCLVASQLHAQETRGQIIGRITDITGAVLVGAQVKGINVDTNVASSASSNATGDYVLPFLIPGTYNVSVQLKGFRNHLERSVVVQADDRVTLNA